jgi:hypothetical protein
VWSCFDRGGLRGTDVDDVADDDNVADADDVIVVDDVMEVSPFLAAHVLAYSCGLRAGTGGGFFRGTVDIARVTFSAIHNFFYNFIIFSFIYSAFICQKHTTKHFQFNFTQNHCYCYEN